MCPGSGYFMIYIMVRLMRPIFPHFLCYFIVGCPDLFFTIISLFQIMARKISQGRQTMSWRWWVFTSTAPTSWDPSDPPHHLLAHPSVSSKRCGGTPAGKQTTSRQEILILVTILDSNDECSKWRALTIF